VFKSVVEDGEAREEGCLDIPLSSAWETRQSSTMRVIIQFPGCRVLPFMLDVDKVQIVTMWDWIQLARREGPGGLCSVTLV